MFFKEEIEIRGVSFKMNMSRNDGNILMAGRRNDIY